MDLLGSILGSMEKPPSLGDAERKKAQGKDKTQGKLEHLLLVNNFLCFDSLCLWSKLSLDRRF